MNLKRILYGAVIVCFIVAHYIALRQIDAHATEAMLRRTPSLQASD